MRIVGSERLRHLGSAIFSEVQEWKAEAVRGGKEVIDLSIGSPDLPPSPRVMEALKRAVQNPSLYGYALTDGTEAFRETAAKWLWKRFGVEVDPKKEILALMGSQDGLAHLALAIANPGDVAVIPNPGYPIYAGGLVLAGVQPYFYPLREENGYLPRLENIPPQVRQKAKLMILNYPSNPLSAVADLAFFEEAVAFARKHEILLVSDMAYSEMAFDGFRPPSVLEVPGAKDYAMELHSLSKSFNMAGCRISFAAGNAEALRALRTLKSNVDYGIFLAVQEAGIVALEEDMEHGGKTAAVYEKRRNAFLSGMKEQGWDIPKPKATMFAWVPIPRGVPARSIAREMVLREGICVVPGDAFGSEGEGYVRVALVRDEETLYEAGKKIGAFLKGAEHERFGTKGI